MISMALTPEEWLIVLHYLTNEQGRLFEKIFDRVTHTAEWKEYLEEVKARG
jgi:hypothetical protein